MLQRWVSIAARCAAMLTTCGLCVPPGAACAPQLDLHELLERADAVATIRVLRIGGEPYGQWAEVRVDHTWKGSLVSSIRLPFVYDYFPVDDVWVGISGAVAMTFDPQQRYLAVLRVNNGNPYNPREASTDFAVINQKENVLIPLEGPDDAALQKVSRVLEILNTDDSQQKMRLLEPLLTHDDPLLRRDAAGVAAHVKSPRAEQRLIDVLRLDRDVGVRTAAVLSLGKRVKTQTAVAALLTAVARDEQSAVQHAAIRALVRLRAAEAVPELAELHREADASAQQAMASAIGQLRHADSFAILRKLYWTSRDSNHKSQILRVMDPPRRAEVALAALKSDDPVVVKIAAVQALTPLEAPLHIAAVVAVTNQPCTEQSSSLIQAAIRALGGSAGTPRQLAAIRQHAACSDLGVRWAAISALGRLDVSGAYTALRSRALVEPNAKLRSRIVQHLEQRGEARMLWRIQFEWRQFWNAALSYVM